MKRICEKGMEVSVSKESFIGLWEAIENSYKFSKECWHVERQM